MAIVIIGAGGIGQHLAQQLGDAGQRVLLGSRSGRGIGPAVATTPSPLVQSISVDAGDSEELVKLCAGADVLVNAVNPQYTKWATDWPPLAANFLQAAERSGAGLLTISNLYGYGRVDAPMTEANPLTPNGIKGQVRAQMWQDALAAHQAGRLRAVELRPSDYFGPGAASAVSYLNRFAIRPAARGKAARHVRGEMTAPHSWSYVADIAALALALIEADQSGPDWGRPWHVPTAPPRSFNEVARDVALLAGTTPRQPRLMPAPVLWALRALPLIRELDETRHQFERPFVLDSSAATERFGLQATAWEEALRRTIAGLTRD